MEKAREKFQDLSEQDRSPADYAMEIPCFPGWNLVSKTKARDIKMSKNLHSGFIWITGLSAAGKTTIANIISKSKAMRPRDLRIISE